VQLTVICKKLNFIPLLR
jgi:hypothetical protein